MKKSACSLCAHRAKRHLKKGVNTSGEFVCMVLGALIPNAFLETPMCSGLYFDKEKGQEQ